MALKDTKFFVGIPQTCNFLLQIIAQESNVPVWHVILTLKKLKCDRAFKELGYEFAVSPSTAARIFAACIPKMTACLKPFLVKLDPIAIKRNLPMGFRQKFRDVCCIIDCFEVEIMKPSKPTLQALTWSSYKNCNTIKFLVAATPDGEVFFISKGYGGRATDSDIVKESNFVDCFSDITNPVILGDRGFKHIEALLAQHNVKLLRPPSAASGTQLSAEDAKLTKQIASLRVHIERVIRRIREFAILKPHSVLHSALLRYIDELVLIACALINVQDSLIR